MKKSTLFLGLGSSPDDNVGRNYDYEGLGIKSKDGVGW